MKEENQNISAGSSWVSEAGIEKYEILMKLGECADYVNRRTEYINRTLQEYYGQDVFDCSLFDLKCDTDGLAIVEIADAVVRAAQEV